MGRGQQVPNRPHARRAHLRRDAAKNSRPPSIIRTRGLNSAPSPRQGFAAEQLPQRREQIQREIDATDRQIDQLVYQLYGLTPDEIKIVEEATAKERHTNPLSA